MLTEVCQKKRTNDEVKITSKWDLQKNCVIPKIALREAAVKPRPYCKYYCVIALVDYLLFSVHRYSG